MRGTVPTLHCDGGNDYCEEWSIDYYEMTADSVDGVKIRREARAPGWRSTDGEDFCPKHAEGGEEA